MRDQELTIATETDVIKTALEFRASSVTAAEQDKAQAREMLARLYPTDNLKPADRTQEAVRKVNSPETGQQI